MERKIALVLSGCGYLDGSEITEAVACLIALSQEGADVEVFAPNQDLQSVDHLTQENQSEARNILIESARIARSKVSDLNKLEASQFDGIVLPGGYGAAKNLSSFAKEGAKASVLPKLKELLQEFHGQSKPIAAFCIAPCLVALSLSEYKPVITIGNDASTMEQLKLLGADPVECPVEDFVTDRENKIITSPAYMYEANPSQVYEGIRMAIREFIEMA